MQFKVFTRRFLLSCCIALSLFLGAQPGHANEAAVGEAVARVLPDRVETFRAKGEAATVTVPIDLDLRGDGILSAYRVYRGPKGAEVMAVVATTPSESAAYALLTRARNALSASPFTGSGIGGVSYAIPSRVIFSKGRVFVSLTASRKGSDNEDLIALAKGLAAKIGDGEGDVPVLLKHLPNWEQIQQQATYFVDLESLKAFSKSPVFEVVNFEGAEAVSANYGNSQLIAVEFTTPQLATENDQRITATLQQLRTAGQSVPVYRRVGNYGVFVFNPESEQAANQLIEQIKYEYITKWLGDSPYPLLEAQRAYRDQTLGVLVSVVKASGLAIVVCLSIGGFFGGLLFIYRRAHKSTEAYSDAGGMLRLNLDEMTPQNDSARLIGPGH